MDSPLQLVDLFLDDVRIYFLLSPRIVTWTLSRGFSLSRPALPSPSPPVRSGRTPNILVTVSLAARMQRSCAKTGGILHMCALSSLRPHGPPVLTLWRTCRNGRASYLLPPIQVCLLHKLAICHVFLFTPGGLTTDHWPGIAVAQE